ncbi:MAG: hypothetical protein LBP28_04525 [Coriobacteriales bacterium]|nr:hypothetical protein [Coriobacteriales bacterium]
MSDYQFRKLDYFLEFSSDLELFGAAPKEFCCSRDRQREDFIHNKSIPYERRVSAESQLMMVISKCTRFAKLP